MKTYNNSKVLVQPKLTDLARGNLKLIPPLESSCIRNCTIRDMALDEKYLLFFSIVDQSSNAVVITDDHKRIVYVNKKFEQISGFTSEMVIGENPSILKSGKTPKETYHDMNRKLKVN